ncbi:hypothetical protein RJ640_004900, partial [Escallonia rubra]
MARFIYRSFIEAKYVYATGSWHRDLSRNYIHGSFPTTFGQLRLTICKALLGNRISGSIPKEFGDTATLEEVILEDNLLGGALPENLRSLSYLRRLGGYFGPFDT